MEIASPEVLQRMPLAQAVLALIRYAFPADKLNELYERDRGFCYERELTFAEMVELTGDCLLNHGSSLRVTLKERQAQGSLPASLRAVYAKLSRMPLAVSQSLLLEGMSRLREVVPVEASESSLAEFEVVIVDGKLVKHVPRRLKPLRQDCWNAQKILGSRALVAYGLNSEMVLGFFGDPDGERCDTKFVPQLMAQLQGRLTRPLFVGDRAFGTVEAALRFGEQGHFVLRLLSTTTYRRDTAVPITTGTDRYGRVTTDEVGWISRNKDDARIRVRLIRVQRDTDAVELITNLLEAQYTADDLLELYLQRWSIETMFQEITEVFDLRHLIGTTPEAMTFQLAYCMLLYNVIRVVKRIIARNQGKQPEDVSSEMLYRDVQKQLTAAYVLLPFSGVEQMGPKFASPDQLREWLEQLLDGCWKSIWEKAKREKRPPNKAAPPQPVKLRQTVGHTSVHRLLKKTIT